MIGRILSVAIMTTMLPVGAWSAEHEEVLVFSFFRDNGQDGMFLARSEDGIHFVPMNEDKPVMKPGPWPGQNLTRDPSIVYHDGTFRAVWTTGWGGQWFGYAESPDLKQWPEQIKVQPFSSFQPQPGNVWAPEICWDPVLKSHMIFWSSGGKLIVTRTTDGKVFSEAKPFFDQGFAAIDGMMVLDGSDSSVSRLGTWVMVLKNEREISDGGKNLRLTTAPADFSKPWAPVSKPIIGPGSPVRSGEMAEGPALVKWKGQWLLYWDAFANGHYSLATSTDLVNWTDRTPELQMPPHPRHGTVFVAPRSAVGWLKGTPPEEIR